MVGLRKILIGLMFICLIFFVVQADPPSVEFITPSSVGEINGSIELRANATDDGNISKVEFFHNGNGKNYWTLIANIPDPNCDNNDYCFVWDTNNVSDGIEYSFRVNVTDDENELNNDSIGSNGNYFTINNHPPTVEVTYPDGDEELNGTVNITAIANDDTTGLQVAFEYSNNSGGSWYDLDIGVLVTGSRYNYSWDTGSLNGTQYLIRATVTDDDELTDIDTSNNTFSVLNMPNDPPIIRVNEVENITSNSITIKAFANDSDGIKEVEFYYKEDDDDSEHPIGLGSYQDGLYERIWNLSESVENGDSYKIIAIATDNRDITNKNESNTFSINIDRNQPPTLTDGEPDDIEGPSPLDVRFTVIYTDIDDDEGNVTLHIDGVGTFTMTKNDTDKPSDGITYEYTRTFNATTDQKVYEFYFNATDGNNTVRLPKDSKKTVTVNPPTFKSGNRIWDEEKNLSKDYTWTPRSFSGFYYNLDTNEGGETLTIKDIGRSIDDGDIEYKTKPILRKFERSAFGHYYVIGFMADRYFAGYENGTIGKVENNLMDEEILSRVLIDNDESQMIKSGIPLVLEEGYEFRVVEYSATGESVMVALFKDGESVDETILDEGSTYTYKKDLGSADDIPIIALRVDTVFLGLETSTINIDGIFQISDNYINVEEGDRFGLMKIDMVDSAEIIMVNSNSVSLKKGKTFNLMGKINIEVGNCDEIRFALTVDTSEPGTYELRGTVTNETSYEWTPLNFEGLLYDMDSGDEEEKLNFKRKNRKIDARDLNYTTSPISMSFEYNGWKDYESIGFMGEKYFAGYEGYEKGIVTERVSLMDKGYLGKILIDEDEKHTLYIGNSLPLADGYSFRIDEISQDGDSIMVALLRDGEEIKSDIINDKKTYTYTKEIDDEDVPMIAINIDTIFRGMESNSIIINGIFQISEDFKKVEEGDSYGNMEIDSVSEDKIIMTNDGSITLKKGDTISIMGDIKIKVADSDTVRFYPYQEIKVESLESLEVDFPDNIYSNQEFTIKVTSGGDEVEDAYVSFGDIEIGATDSNGELVYTPTETGSFNITASKSGYNSDSSEIEVIFQPKALSISFPSVVDKNELFTISVTSEGSPLSGASVMFGSIDLGTTPTNGNITYTPDEIGTFTITASKTGYQDVSKDIDISDPSAKLVFSNLTIDPEEVEPGQIVTISVETANFGTLREAETVILNINQEEESSRDVTLGPGEITTLTFSVNKSKSGTYDVEIGGREGSFKVKGDSSISTIALILLGIIGIISIGAIIYSVSQGNLSFDSMTGKANEIEQKMKRLIEK